MTSVDTTSQEDIRFASIKVRGAHKILGGTVAVVITPSAGTLAGERIGDDLIRLATQSVHIDQEFISRVSIGHVGGMSDGVTCVDATITNGLSLPDILLLVMDDHSVGTA